MRPDPHSAILSANLAPFPMTGLELLFGSASLLVGFGLFESFSHRRQLSRIPTRIHVSGTRGKSSVTRLLAAGLRECGIRNVAKTTGTLARVILPDGRELPIFRPIGPNVIEQKRVVQVAADLEADALVAECMALQPWLHWLSESKLIRATHGVITNARADHLDVMGPTEADVARTLAGMIPIKGVLYTCEQRHIEILERAAKDRDTRLVQITRDDVEAITEDNLDAFRYVEHRDNIALALRILTDLGVDRHQALIGMQAAAPDPGALTALEVDFFGRNIIFVNAFAANDPESTGNIWRQLNDTHHDVSNTVAVFNLRADRPSRTLQLANASFWHTANHIVLIGSGAYLFAKTAATRGVDPGRFVYAEQQGVAEIFETILGVCQRKTLVVGMANIGGQGLKLARYFENRARLPI